MRPAPPVAGGVRVLACPLRTRALPDNGVERIRKEAARAAVEAADVPEVAGFFEVTLHEPHAAPVV
jgi:hypothetical protein